ncbi:MAG: hypothetical protein HY553_03755 [Elusimicrobia bacterium]|nr:hypothetical protein [Elusimicrobiota bacterium]
MDDIPIETFFDGRGVSDGRDERKAHGIADVLLRHAILDADILRGLSGWQEGKNAAVAISNLLYWPERYPEMRHAAAACRLQAGDFLLQLGDVAEAQRLYALVSADKSRDLKPYRALAQARLGALERSRPKN